MAYQQTTSHTETLFPSHSASNMYAQAQLRTPRDPQGHGSSFAHASAPGAHTESNPMGAIINQFAGLALPGANMAAAQFPLGGQVQYYVTPDGQFLMAPTGMYSSQAMSGAQLPEASYSPYGAALPYLAQAAYPGYLTGYPMLPYTTARAGHYPDHSDHHKEVPGLDNRRGSYSTNESAPSTPFYSSVSQREQTTHIAAVDRSPFGSTPSPQQLHAQHAGHQTVKGLPYKTVPINIDLDALLVQHPAIPRAVPAVFTPRESLRTLDQSLSNPIPGNRNVYIRGLHPNTDDETIAAYAARFGRVETSKAIIDTSTGACKGFGFAKYANIRDSELCIRGFYKLGYEVGFARESFNSRLKAEGDENSTNLYVSNLPMNMTESELGAIFMDYNVVSSRILRDSNKNSRGVGFARFDCREVCHEIIKKFHGQPIGEEGLLLQVRFADTPGQKDLKRITTERRQFRTNEYNVGAYGAPNGLPISPPVPSPVLPRTSMVTYHVPKSRAGSSWKREASSSSTSTSAPIFKHMDRQVRASLTEPTPNKSKNIKSTPSVSETSSASGGTPVRGDAPSVVRGGSVSPTARKS
ncbi:RNA-binding, RBD [Venustampulla echinocandica]|uniref:RNA-binding, RBD n=1 Tax=Venustampulla echinocandica TaxID=2656787 RepID=A0A370TCI9_9HELO|nr:RNA-binding, RBD [Venustampulla echinocandica]RDL31945.1 RNA-binding, RBD [Venustampulla echinocandica]